MKKNKGFTLIELLAVIVILALLLTIAVPSVISLSNRIKRNMFCNKVDNIETAAKIYANDNVDGFTNDTMTISVSTLIDNNLFKKEDKNCSLGSNNKPCVKDPRNNSGMDNATIVLSKQDKKLFAKYQYNPGGTKKTEDEEYCKNN